MKLNMSTKERKVVIKKVVILLSSVGFMLIAVNALAESNYGIRGLISSQSANSSESNQKNSKQSEESMIRSLLAKARANKNSNTQAPKNKNAKKRSKATTATRRKTTRPVRDTGLSEQAFANTVRNMMPLSPSQIRSLRRLFDASQRAAATYPGVPPKPTSTSVIVNLSPGATPPVIRLSAGFVSSLVFLDSTGAPWPIKAIDVGDPKGFNVEWNKKSNTLLVQALTHYKTGNLAVLLKGLDTPVMLTLLPGQDAVDYRVDLRVPGLGPDAKPALNGLPGATSPKLLQVLNGVPPSGSKSVIVNGGACQGWLVGKHLFLRTRLTVLSPAWIGTMSSADGTHAYELQKTPVVLASQHGKLVKLTIKGL